MEDDGYKAIIKAQELLAESGKLDIMARRKIWQAMGALEEREEDSFVPRTLTEPLKKRALLALACAKKVMPVWSKYDPLDKRPQKLIKMSLAYLDGKITVQELDVEVDAFNDLAELADSGEIATSAAIAAWDGAVVALEDEAQLEPWCLDTTEEEMDSYDWDAAKNACVAFSDAYAEGDNGKCAVYEMKFWAWYLEEAAKLLGIEDYRFPPKYIKAYKEKQNPPKPVPEEVTLESFVDFLDLGEYVYHHKVTVNREETGEDGSDYYAMFLRLNEDYGICPVCQNKVYKVRHAGTNCRLDWYDYAFPSKEPQLSICQFDFKFCCPDHPNESIYCPSDVYKNVKAAVKRYIKGEGRLAKLLNELEQRKTEKYFKVWGNSIVINGRKFSNLAAVEANKEALGLCNAGWVDKENKVYGLDLRQYLPIFYIYGRPYEDYLRYSPEEVHKNEDGTLELITHEFKLRCTMENGQPVYAEITSIYRLLFKKKDDPALLEVLVKEMNLPEEAAVQAVQNADEYFGEWEIKPLTAMTEDAAQLAFLKFKEAGVNCRLIPKLF